MKKNHANTKSTSFTDLWNVGYTGGLIMAEYIEREALIKRLTSAGAMCDWGLYLIKDEPAADVTPIRHGEWVWGGFDGKGYPVWCS